MTGWELLKGFQELPWSKSITEISNDTAHVSEFSKSLTWVIKPACRVSNTGKKYLTPSADALFSQASTKSLKSSRLISGLEREYDSSSSNELSSGLVFACSSKTRDMKKGVIVLLLNLRAFVGSWYNNVRLGNGRRCQFSVALRPGSLLLT